MIINTNHIISVTEANQNFSKVAHMADNYGQVVIFKNNKPKYVLYDIENAPPVEMSEDEKFEFIARRILNKHKKAFEELAK